MKKKPVKNILPSMQRSAPPVELATYHDQLISQMSQQPPVFPTVNPDTPKLMHFNGYYRLDHAPGAFFAVDTNMVVTTKSHKSQPHFDLTLIISLDGTEAKRYPFKGKFNGTTLHQTSKESTELSINLTFTRTAESYGRVAACRGTITLPGQSSVSVSGFTYNNPIPASLYAGTYYTIRPDGTQIKVMKIGSDNQLSYDNGSNSGQLSPVTNYVYNMNMYYFTFGQGADKTRLIMGTAANKGLACNNMVIGESPRSLLTIPNAETPKIEFYDLSSCQLADFSGYYPIPSKKNPLAFVSIQAQYATILPNTQWDLNFVMISVSLDGVKSHGYYFDPFTMKFDHETLHMPEQGISLKLIRKYDSENGSLVSIKGTIKGQEVSGFTPFNPVPLSAFEGLPMTNSQHDKLTVNNDNSVTYNETKMNSIIYVPLMYILAYPTDSPSVVMSFGTHETHGNTCIVTEDANTENPKTVVVQAIPS